MTEQKDINSTKPMSEKRINSTYSHVMSFHKNRKMITDAGNHSLLHGVKGGGLKPFEGKFTDPASAKGPVNVESFEDGELETTESIHQRYMKGKKDNKSYNYIKIKEHGEGQTMMKKVAYDTPLSKKFKDLPTSEMIYLLAEQWKKPVVPGIKTDVVWQERCEKTAEEKKPMSNSMRSLISGGAAGIVSTALTQPLQQVANMKGTFPAKYLGKTMWESAKMIHKEHGLKGFYAGYGASALRALPQSALWMLTAAATDKALQAKRNANKLEKKGAYFIGVDASPIAEQMNIQRNPEDLHMTVAYLGNKSEEDIERIKGFLKGQAERNHSFTTKAPFYARFAERYPHLGVEKNKQLSALQKPFSQYDNMSDIGRSYTPHITIGNPQDVPVLPDDQNITLPVDNLTLYSTIQGEPGHYEKVERYDLHPANFLDRLKSFLMGQTT